MTRAVRPMLIASAKMFYRSADTIWFATLSPFVLFGIFALVKHLRFALPGGEGTIDFFTFTAIGYAAFIAAHFHQDGTVGGASGYRAAGVLKRLAVTPISPAAFVAGHVLMRLMVGLAQTIAILAVGVALGAGIAYTPDLLWILPIAALALLTGVGFGFAIAGAAQTPEGANQLNITIFAPVFLLAGAQYPLQALPGPLPQLAEYMVPFAAPVQAFREAVAGHLAGDFARLLVLALAWLAVAIALAARSYRFTDRDA